MNVLRLLPLLFLAACATTTASSSSSVEALGPELQTAIREKNWAAALPLARQRVSEQPRNARAWQSLGLAQAGQDNHRDAISAFKKSLSLEDDVKVRVQLGASLAMEKRIGEARIQFERAVTMDPQNGGAWLMLGQTQALLSQWDEATASIARARALMPEDEQSLRMALLLARMQSVSRLPKAALAHHEQGGVLAGQGRNDEARQEYEAALKLAPGFADCHYNLGLLARRGGDLARAEQEYRAAIAAYPPGQDILRADALNNLADTMVARGGDAAEAVRLAREAIALRGARPSYLDTLARACDAQGNAPCASKAFRELLKSADSLPPEVREHAEKRLGAQEGG